MARNITSMRKAHDAQKTTWAPYTPLDAAAEKYFYDLITSRASFDWSRADVITLTRLATWFARADEYTARLDLEGITITNAKGTEVMNPLFFAIDQLERRIVGVMAKLCIYSLSSNSVGGGTLTGERAKDANEVANVPKDPLLG